MIESLPLVSIITPVYNGAQFIEELILSVKNQDYPNIEHIIVDDGSDDNGATVGVLKRYPHLRWWTRPNQGQYATMNEGLSKTKGEIVCFVSADDKLPPGAVKIVVDFLTSQPGFDGMFGMTGYMNEEGNRVEEPVLFEDAPFSFVKYLAHVPHCSFYIRRDALVKHQLFFNPSLFYVGDYEWMIRIAQKGLKIGKVTSELALVRFHPLQATQVAIASSLQERQKVFKEYHVNFLLRKLLWLIHFVNYRVWQMGQEYKRGGLGAMTAFVLDAIRTRLHFVSR